MRDPDLRNLPAVSLVSPDGAHRSSPTARTKGNDVEPSIAERERIAFERGLAAGRETAEASVSVEVSRILGALTASALEVDAARNAWAAVGPDLATDLALELAEMILMREVATAADPGRDAIRRCFDQLSSDESVTVRLNPSDIDLLGANTNLDAGRTIKIVADDSVDPGGAIADFPGGTVDASITSALDRAREVLGQ